MGFVHLHVHSQYSFQDGASPLDKLLDKTVFLSMLALTLTDHNRLTGAVRFYEKARALGIKPIIGAEAQNRTGDTRIFSPLLYRLSYLGTENIVSVSYMSVKQTKPLLYSSPCALSVFNQMSCWSGYIGHFYAGGIWLVWIVYIISLGIDIHI